MRKWKVNLDKVWNLPIGVGKWNNDGKYCALGLVGAACLGEDAFSLQHNWSREEVFFRECLINILKNDVKPYIGLVFDDEIKCSPKEQHEAIREKYVRIILNKGLEAGIFELEDSDLNIVKELQNEIKSRNSAAGKEQNVEQESTNIPATEILTSS